MAKIAVNGALGRMGSRILSLAYQSGEHEIVAAFEHAKHPSLGKDLGSALGLGDNLKVRVTELTEQKLAPAQVLIDFSSPEGVSRSLDECLDTHTALVIGTTGVSDVIVKKIKDSSKKIAIVYSPNMSIGANFLFRIAAEAAKRLTQGYDIEIIEAHHRLKKDAPSGTAKKIAEVIAAEKGWDLSKTAKYGRQGMTGERPAKEIGIHVVRAGDIVGEHTVIFGGPGETIELKHKALSRDAFARGALVAAAFLAKKKNGLFTMADVIG